jgi:hypothetical protein
MGRTHYFATDATGQLKKLPNAAVANQYRAAGLAVTEMDDDELINQGVLQQRIADAHSRGDIR